MSVQRGRSALHSWAPLGAAVLLLALGAQPALGDGTETLGPPTLPIASGSGIAIGGIGLADAQPGNLGVSVPAGATVKQVLLYWEGANLVSADATPTQTIEVNGSAVTGSLIGGDTEYEIQYRTASYRADITSLGLIGPGSNTLSVGGLDFTQENDGAGVFVIYDDGSSATVEVRDGNDFAHIRHPGSLMVTVPQTFTFAAVPFDRTAGIDLLVGSVADDTGYLGFRPSSIEVTVGGTTTTFSDQLSSLSGRLLDALHLEVEVPAGETSVTVQLFSRNDEGDWDCTVIDLCPASMVWVAAGLSIEEGDGCITRTPGFWCNRPLAVDFLLPVEVCGITLDNVAPGTQGSAIEDLVFGRDHMIDNGGHPVDPGSVGYPHGISATNLQLVRQCAAARLNLAATGAARGNCGNEIPGILERIDECCDVELCTDSLAAIDASGCVGDLDEFNKESFGGNELAIPDGFPTSRGTGVKGYFPPGSGDSSICSRANGNGFINSR